MKSICGFCGATESGLQRSQSITISEKGLSFLSNSRLLFQWEGTIKLAGAIRRGKQRFKSLRISIYFGTDFLIAFPRKKKYLYISVACSLKAVTNSRLRFLKTVAPSARDDSFHVAQSQGISCQNKPASIRSCGWCFGSVIPTHSLLFRRQSAVSFRNVILERTLFCKMHCFPKVEGIRS